MLSGYPENYLLSLSDNFFLVYFVCFITGSSPAKPTQLTEGQQNRSCVSSTLWLIVFPFGDACGNPLKTMGFGMCYPGRNITIVQLHEFNLGHRGYVQISVHVQGRAFVVA